VFFSLKPDANEISRIKSRRESMSVRTIQKVLSSQPKSIPINDTLDLAEIEHSICYLSSEKARQSLNADPYWPKWDSPWWHMSVLYEMGLAQRIPKMAIQWMIDAARRQYVPHFFASEVPLERDPVRDTFCHCALGNLFQIMSAAGADMDQVLPWARSWFIRYQMPDGGLNCDEEAYRVNPPASSLVGTMATLEAILWFTPRPFTAEENKFLEQGARFLIERELRYGCPESHNAEELLDESDWQKLCFPRFYFYDVLRGLNFILHWTEGCKKPLSVKVILNTIENIHQQFPDGQIRIERHSFEGVETKIQLSSGEWRKNQMASLFPLLTRVSEIGTVSPYLTSRWNEAKARIRILIERGLIV
jgi:hypothetical protein